jgi:hypothetical protein
VSESGYVVMWRVRIAGKHVPTGNTAHYRGDAVLPPPQSLQIAQYPGDEGYYLLYLGENGEELTDTYHGDVSSAMEQAEWEFGVKVSDWQKAT